MTQTIDADDIFCRNRDIISTQMDDETVMMSIARGEYHGINPVGSRIWELLEQPLSISQLCRLLMEDYDIDETACLRDVTEFIEKLREKELINPVSNYIS